jgi:hypothetical protein
VTASASTYNGWLVIRTDAVGKRAVVKGQRCERVQQVSVESLADRTFKACGCTARPSAHTTGEAAPVAMSSCPGRPASLYYDSG